VAGRVEHVVSGQATHFASLEELLAFIVRVLAQGQASWGNDECCTPPEERRWWPLNVGAR
jgi:hypothetical protein